MQGWYYVESLKGQRHVRVQTESQIATPVDSCFDLVESLQHGVASCEVFSWSIDIHKPAIYRWWWPQMKLLSKSLPIGQCHMQNASVRRDNRKNLEYRVLAAIRKLRTDTNRQCPAGKSWSSHVKNEQHIGPEKIYGPQNTEKLKLMMQRSANENAACLRRICKRSDQPRRLFLADHIFYRSYVDRQHFVCGPLHHYLWQ